MILACSPQLAISPAKREAAPHRSSGGADDAEAYRSGNDGFFGFAEPFGRIATVRADGSPSVVPVWFIFEGGKVLITPRKHSAFLQNLRREPRVAITIDEEAGRHRKVLFEGKAEILFEPGDDRKWDDIYRRIACRYVDKASADYT